MTKGLKELKRLPNAIKDTFKDSFDIIKKELKESEKNKKALKIIKRVLNIPYKKAEIENWEIMRYINKKESDLLKEVLEDEK